MNERLVIACFMTVHLATCSAQGAPATETADPCPEVRSLDTIPFRGQPGESAVYDRLRFGPECEGVLLRSVESTEPMTDPRQVPPDSRFVVGDAALFLLLARHSLDLDDVLPPDVYQKFDEMGATAYFDHVAEKENRAKVGMKLRALIASHSGNANRSE